MSVSHPEECPACSNLRSTSVKSGTVVNEHYSFEASAKLYRGRWHL